MDDDADDDDDVGSGGREIVNFGPKINRSIRNYDNFSYVG
jgi:hypothetical protein